MTSEENEGRRYLIAVGVGEYLDGAIADLPEAPGDAERVHALLKPMGYTRVLTELSFNPAVDALRRGIDRWTVDADLGPRDVVCVYFAGHGIKAPDRHYLLCADTEPDLISSALASEDLCRPLMYSPLGHLLVMLDTCYAGEGTGDIAVLAADLAATQRGPAGRWLLASARGKDQALENAFVDALTKVLDQPQAGAYPEFLGVREVTERVNGYFHANHPAQHARLSTIDSDGHAPFFHNAAHIHGLPANDLDISTLKRLRKATRGHFDSRARGLEHAGERGDYFTGRTAALAVLASWLRAEKPHDRKARVVTGNPGSGKSALLGRLLMLTDPDHPARKRTPDRALPPPGLTVVPLHARRASLEELTSDLAATLHLPNADRDDLLTALGRRTDPVTVLVDALDEAGIAGDATEGARIARELLQPLSVLPALRLIIGARRNLIPALGRAVAEIDLDKSDYVTDDDVADYARDLLLDAQDSDTLSPYSGRPEQANIVARGIASRAGTSFLVARMTARALVHGQISVDTTQPGWQNALPSDAGQAFAAYLARFSSKKDKVERLLRPLAYAQGSGLPWSTLWAPIAEALSGVPCPQEDLRWLHEHAGAYVVETPVPTGSAYRLFHEIMAEHLRTPRRDRDAHQTITDALLAQVPYDPRTDRHDWPAAHPYIRDYLATHAAAAANLDPLLHDTEYLIHATPTTLVRALHTTTTPNGRLRCAIYRTSADTHPHAGPQQRRDVLAIDAARYNQPALARQFSRGRLWQPRWATGSLVHPALHSILTGHTRLVRAVACTTIDGRSHAITCSDDGTVRLWDLETGTQRTTLTGHTDWVRAAACATIDGRPHAITGGDDGTVRVWDLQTGTHHTGHTGHTGSVQAIACTTIDGRPHAITASYDDTVRVWNLQTGTQRTTLTGHTGSVQAIACTTIDGRPHAITASNDNTVRVWDLQTGTHHIGQTGHTNWVQAIACTTVNGRPHAITASNDDTVRVWDLETGTHHTTLTGHTGSVRTIACSTINGRSHAITASYDNTVRVWDLETGTHHTGHTGHTGSVRAIACTTVNGRPHAITTSNDNTVRVWDLQSGAHHTALTGSVRAIACTTVNGRSYAITGSDDGTVLVRDLETGDQRTALTGHTGSVQTIACTTINDRPHAITTSNDSYESIVRVWDLQSGAHHTTLTGHTGLVRAIACTTINGQPHAITTSNDGSVRVWNLETGAHHTTLTGHTGLVRAIACTTINGQPHAITGSYDGSVRVWNVETGAHHSPLIGHTNWVQAIACTTIDGRPHAITTGYDRTVRVWDLAVNRLVETIALPLPADAVAASGTDIVIGMRNEVVVLAHTPDAS